MKLLCITFLIVIVNLVLRYHFFRWKIPILLIGPFHNFFHSHPLPIIFGLLICLVLLRYRIIINNISGGGGGGGGQY